MSDNIQKGSDVQQSAASSASSLIPPILPTSSHANPFAAMKPSLGRKATSNSSDDGGMSSCSDNNNSDNSALVSIGNNSFGFNFPNESSNGSDSDGNGVGGQQGDAPFATRQRLPPVVSGSSFHSNTMARHSDSSTKASSLTNNDSSGSETNESSSRAKLPSKESSSLSVTLNRKISTEESAAALKTIALSAAFDGKDGSQISKRSSKDFGDGSEEGYNTDTDDDDRSASQPAKKSRSSQGSSLDGTPRSSGGRARKKNSDKRREERNAREKERSFRIAKQINELRDLLSAGGVVLPKGTKSSVLTEAASYIRLLQQHQARSEIERLQLIQQMHLIGTGANGPEAAKAIRRAAAQNGVWSLGNFGGVPPKSAMVFSPPSEAPARAHGSSGHDILQHSVSADDYRFIFNSAGVGLAVSSMGGSLIDCNDLFSMLSGYTKQELCALTVFNLTARSDLQNAFDLISQMISPSIIDGYEAPKQVLLRGAMKSRSDLGLCISLVRGDSGAAKCFCITLIRNPSSPSSTEQPVLVSFDSVLRPSNNAVPTTLEFSSSATTGKTGKIIATTPALTSG